MTHKYVKPGKSFTNGNTIEHNASGSIESLQTVPQLPLEQFCFQGEEYHTKTIINATMKY
jgi:hypothetical protein